MLSAPVPSGKGKPTAPTPEDTENMGRREQWSRRTDAPRRRGLSAKDTIRYRYPDMSRLREEREVTTAQA